MADLDDLLGDISNVERDGYDIDQEEDGEDGIIPGLDGVGIRSEVPSALATAAEIRRRRVPFTEDGTNDNDDLGGGQSLLYGRRGGFEDNGEEDNYGDDDDDENGERNYNPDYETLKALWTSELACPELLPHDAETVLQIVDNLSAQEEIINDLLQRSKQPPPLLPQSSTTRGGGGEGGGPTAELASLVHK